MKRVVRFLFFVLFCCLLTQSVFAVVDLDDGNILTLTQENLSTTGIFPVSDAPPTVKIVGGSDSVYTYKSDYPDKDTDVYSEYSRRVSDIYGTGNWQTSLTEPKGTGTEDGNYGAVRSNRLPNWEERNVPVVTAIYPTTVKSIGRLSYRNLYYGFTGFNGTLYSYRQKSVPYAIKSAYFSDEEIDRIVTKLTTSDKEPFTVTRADIIPAVGVFTVRNPSVALTHNIDIYAIVSGKFTKAGTATVMGPNTMYTKDRYGLFAHNTTNNGNPKLYNEITNTSAFPIGTRLLYGRMFLAQSNLGATKDFTGAYLFGANFRYNDGYGSHQWESKVDNVTGDTTVEELFSNYKETEKDLLRVSRYTIKNCYTNSGTLTATVPVEITGGQYIGSPALNSKNITVKVGQLTDKGGATDTSKRSSYTLDAESKATTKTIGSDFVTDIELRNPPVIIDWSNFPGLDLDIDLNAPIIQVSRIPADSSTPTSQVTLEIKVTDPDEHQQNPTVSVNGGPFTSIGPSDKKTYVVGQNQTVTIYACDENGNMREFSVTIDNIDTKAPEIIGFTPSTTEWTKGAVRVYVNAQDDQGLAAKPYSWTFTPASGAPGGTASTLNNTAQRYFDCTSNGTLKVVVKDTVNHTTENTYQVTNIDKTAPTFTISQSPSGSVSKEQGKTLSVSITNTPSPGAIDGSPLDPLYVQWGAGSPWVSTSSCVVHANGSIAVSVRDSMGNATTKTVNVSGIITEGPNVTLTSDSGTGTTYSRPPVTLTATARPSAGTSLPPQAYSWDRGVTWTHENTKIVYEPGDYGVRVRDNVGNYTDAFVRVGNIDNTQPTVNLSLIRKAPANWQASWGEPTDADLVYWLKVIATDSESGVKDMIKSWDGQTTTTNPLEYELKRTGTYGVTVTDNAGNVTYADIVVTSDKVGDSLPVPRRGSEIPVGPSRVAAPRSIVGPGAHARPDADISSLIYGPTGVFDTTTNVFHTYDSGSEGIKATCNVSAANGKWLTGYAMVPGLNETKYPVSFNLPNDPVRGDNTNLTATVFIPWTDITKDIRNGDIIWRFQEWDTADDARNQTGTPYRENPGATTRFNAQKSNPSLSWDYNKTLNEFSIIASSAPAAITKRQYKIDGGSWVDYTGPFALPDSGTTLVIKAVNAVGGETTETLDIADVRGGAGPGGVGGTIPTEEIDPVTGGNGINSFYMSGRTSEAYIIGGTRSNTNQVPSDGVISSIIG